MDKKPLNLILLGDPASGKGTQAARLAKKYRFYDLDMGKELRKPAVRARYDYARTNALGKLTPTGVARDIFRRVIEGTPARQGILFNGNPKMISEARLVAAWLKKQKRSDPLVIYLKIPMRETLGRAKKRREYVGGKLAKRDDDTERAIENRKQYYEEQISQVVAFFRKQYGVTRISGVGSRDEVWKRILSVVSRHLKNNK